MALYIRGGGKITSQLTKQDGTFAFVGLQPRSEEYWLSILSGGHFSVEVLRLTVVRGLEAVYAPITMESCRPGGRIPSDAAAPAPLANETNS